MQALGEMKAHCKPMFSSLSSVGEVDIEVKLQREKYVTFC